MTGTKAFGIACSMFRVVDTWPVWTVAGLYAIATTVTTAGSQIKFGLSKYKLEPIIFGELALSSDFNFGLIVVLHHNYGISIERGEQ